MLWYVILVLCAVSLSIQNEADLKVVNISQGPVRGRKDPDGIYVFYNIPYATAPTGDNKFKAPLPPPNWTEPLDAIDKRVICLQANFEMMDLSSRAMQEDCLIANVYVPDTEEKDLSVMVHIHGGAFQVGSGETITARSLIKSNKIILVNFNYRLGINGFLCLGTKDIPGNAGMKDMVALLRWVNTNIASFGGNPHDVTLVGYSAGAAAADLLILSKSAKGLFQKVILESGSSLAEFAVQSDPLENAKMHAKTLNFTNVDDVYALEKFYKTLPYSILTQDAFSDRKDSTFMFSPCVERDAQSGDEVFLHDTPRNILKKGEFTKVHMLNGFANMEGLFRISKFDSWSIVMNRKFSDFLPADLTFDSDEQKKLVANQIKDFYFHGKPVGPGNVLEYVDYFTDVLFATPALRSLHLNLEAGNTDLYLYEFSFVDNDTSLVPHTTVRGAGHCAQTQIIFDWDSSLYPDDKIPSPEHEKIQKIMREMWGNFIRSGKPVPHGSSLPPWPAVSLSSSSYMSLGETVELRTGLLADRATFWKNIYEKYYREPVPPKP
nr:juvenile hormone esterase [Helicoverpa armigera]WRX06141.1 CCE001v [Helicoverpa armigera]